MKNRYQESDATPGEATNAGGVSFYPELLALFRHPQQILFLWNWKSAWLSLALRGPIFLAAAFQRGFSAALSAVLTESVFCTITAGFYGAIAQRLRDARPEWLTLLFLTVVVPAVAVEFLMHRFHGPPHLRIAEIVSIYVKAPLARFNSQYRLIYPNQFVPMGSRIQNILAEERPDIVEICDKYTLNCLGALLRRDLLPALNFRPIVVGLTCERMDDNFRSYVGHLSLSRAFCAAYMQWLYFPFFDHHIANSEYTADELRSASRGQIVPRNVWIRPWVSIFVTSRPPESLAKQGANSRRSATGPTVVCFSSVPAGLCQKRICRFCSKSWLNS